MLSIVNFLPMSTARQFSNLLYFFLLLSLICFMMKFFFNHFQVSVFANSDKSCALLWSHGCKDTCSDEVFYEPKQQSLRAVAIHKEGWIAWIPSFIYCVAVPSYWQEVQGTIFNACQETVCGTESRNAWAAQEVVLVKTFAYSWGSVWSPNFFQDTAGYGESKVPSCLMALKSVFPYLRFEVDCYSVFWCGDCQAEFASIKISYEELLYLKNFQKCSWYLFKAFRNHETAAWCNAINMLDCWSFVWYCFQCSSSSHHVPILFVFLNSCFIFVYSLH